VDDKCKLYLAPNEETSCIVRNSQQSYPLLHWQWR